MLMLRQIMFASLVAASTLFGVNTGQGAETPLPSPALGQTQAEMCAPLMKNDVGDIREKLMAFKTVFGKPSIRWTESDFDQVVALAHYCQDMTTPNGSKFVANMWESMITGVREHILAVAEQADTVARYGQTLHPDQIRFPVCWALLDYTYDDYNFTDNAAQLFGRRFISMTDKDIKLVVDYTNECFLFIRDYAKGSRNWQDVQTDKVINSIIDKALYFEQKNADWRDFSVARGPSDIMIQSDGIDVPYVFATPATRSMITLYNRAAAVGRRFTPETIAELTAMIDNTIAANKSVIDVQYANVIKDKVEEQIFKK